MPANQIAVNRAPVLTLWAAVVAARMGYDWETALSFGRAVAGLNAQAKGRRLGIYGPPKRGEGKEPKRTGLGEELWVEVCGRPIPAKHTERGLRAVVGAEPIEPESVEAYLRRSLGEHYQAVREAMAALAASRRPEELAEEAYGLYTRFRPAVASGRRGWGQKGVLDLDLIRSLAEPGNASS